MRKKTPYIFLYRKGKLSQYFPFFTILLILFFVGCKKDASSTEEGPIVTYNYNGGSYDVKGTVGERIGNAVNIYGVSIDNNHLVIEDGDKTHPFAGCIITITRNTSETLKVGNYSCTGWNLGFRVRDNLSSYDIETNNVTITKVENNKVSGTFSFTAKYNPSYGSGGPPSITVNGSFKNVVIK